MNAFSPTFTVRVNAFGDLVAIVIDSVSSIMPSMFLGAPIPVRSDRSIFCVQRWAALCHEFVHVSEVVYAPKQYPIVVRILEMTGRLKGLVYGSGQRPWELGVSTEGSRRIGLGLFQE